MKLPPRTQNAVCQTGRPRRLSRPTISMCAFPTLSMPNFTSYSIRSPTVNGTLARLTLDAAMIGAGVTGADCAPESPKADTAKAATAKVTRFTPHLRHHWREGAPYG